MAVCLLTGCAGEKAPAETATPIPAPQTVPDTRGMEPWRKALTKTLLDEWYNYEKAALEYIGDEEVPLLLLDSEDGNDVLCRYDAEKGKVTRLEGASTLTHRDKRDIVSTYVYADGIITREFYHYWPHGAVTEAGTLQIDVRQKNWRYRWHGTPVGASTAEREVRKVLGLPDDGTREDHFYLLNCGFELAGYDKQDVLDALRLWTASEQNQREYWAQRYLGFFSDDCFPDEPSDEVALYDSYVLLDLDGNGVPEMVCRNDREGAPSWYEFEIVDVKTRRLEQCSFTADQALYGEGLIYAQDGGKDTVYRVTAHDLKTVLEGLRDRDWDGRARYILEGEEVSASEYRAAFTKAFPVAQPKELGAENGDPFDTEEQLENLLSV